MDNLLSWIGIALGIAIPLAGLLSIALAGLLLAIQVSIFAVLFLGDLARAGQRRGRGLP